ncbi:hypothetical protein C8J57DRAFT_1346597 [Mycena rebaudengoi]|nr:hypothetical protein C8J57DRAFT_1346597 [Mycena rebaudengoi]
MNHPYSGTASYIYANEYPRTPVRETHYHGPYVPTRSFHPTASIDSFPTTTNAYAPSYTEYSTDDGHGHGDGRARRDSHRPLLPPLRQHPYANNNNSDFIDLESIAETPVSAHHVLPYPALGMSPQHVLKPHRAPRPEEPRFPGAEEERRRKGWRRKIQKRIRRALRRLRRLFQGL